jgi:hypothetical protein
MSNYYGPRNGLEPCKGSCKRLPTEELATLLVEVILPRNDGKFTFCALHLTDRHFGSWSDPLIYIVSYLGHEQRFKTSPTTGDFASWIEPRRETLFHLGYYIGLYRPNGEFCLDLSLAVCGLEFAIATAQANKQDEIYHPATDQLIQVHQTILRAANHPEISSFANKGGHVVIHESQQSKIQV